MTARLLSTCVVVAAAAVAVGTALGVVRWARIMPEVRHRTVIEARVAKELRPSFKSISREATCAARMRRLKTAPTSRTHRCKRRLQPALARSAGFCASELPLQSKLKDTSWDDV